MAITGYIEKPFTESSLSTSETFSMFKAIGDPLEKAKNIIKSGKVLTSEDIESAYINLKQYVNGLSRAALKAFDTGTVKLIYNHKAIDMSRAFPFMTFKQGEKYITYVFMDAYIKETKEGVLTINQSILHNLLTGALIANRLKMDYSALQGNQYLEKILMNVYASFVTRILNREYGIGADKQISDSVQYCVNRFFLEHIFGATETPENIDTLSSKQLKYIDEIKMEDIRAKYNEAKPDSISKLLDLIKTLSVRMNSLTMKLFADKWITYYYPPATLAIDNIEYLIFMLLTGLRAPDGLISTVVSDMVKETKDIKMVQEELLKLV